MPKSIVALFFIFSPLEIFAEEEEKIRLSKKYHLGSSLIFDCEDQHFACVSFLDYEKCERDWKKDQEEISSFFRCAPFKKFLTNKECFKSQGREIEKSTPKSFCHNFKKGH